MSFSSQNNLQKEFKVMLLRVIIFLLELKVFTTLGILKMWRLHVEFPVLLWHTQEHRLTQVLVVCSILLDSITVYSQPHQMFLELYTCPMTELCSLEVISTTLTFKLVPRKLNSSKSFKKYPEKRYPTKNFYVKNTSN